MAEPPEPPGPTGRVAVAVLILAFASTGLAVLWLLARHLLR